jgi:hypothetical protein
MTPAFHAPSTELALIFQIDCICVLSRSQAVGLVNMSLRAERSNLLVDEDSRWQVTAWIASSLLSSQLHGKQKVAGCRIKSGMRNREASGC